jgi:hypothetical protein
MNETFYKNVRPVSRTLDEAYKTPTYAQAIWRCESETERGLSALFEKLVGMSLLFVFGFTVASFTIWLTNT